METLTKPKFIEPHTRAWTEARLGKFTSSEIHKLFVSGRKKDELFGKGAITYIQTKVAEILTGESKNPTSIAMDWGLSNERDAILRYEQETGVKTNTSGFYIQNDIYGGSPDAEVGDDGILEVKCPYASENHLGIYLCNSVDELRDFEESYYTQPQGNMYITGRQWCDFISYDPRCYNPKFQIKIIRIYRDEEFIKELEYRVGEAAEIMNNYLQKLLQ
jgi:hypothetical protein